MVDDGSVHRDRRLRVTYLVPPSPVFAGVERVTHEIASALARQSGDELHVEVIYATVYDDPELASPPYVRRDLDVTKLRDLPRRLRIAVRASRPDVLICAQVEPSVLAWVATRGLGVRHFIPHLHGNPAVEEQRGGFATKAAFQVFRHVVSRRVTAIFAVAPSLAEYIRRRVTRHAPVHWVMNPARALHDPRPPRASGFRFVNVARHSYQKGLDILLTAWSLAAPAIPEATLTLVGSGPDEEELRRLADTLGISDSVEFAGFHPQPGELMAQGDCFVLSSRWEGFPLVLLEALSLGLPVLAADCDFGPRDLITEPALGRLVPQGDPALLAAEMVRMAGDAPVEGAQDVRRAAAARYEPDAAARQHLEVLRRVLASGARTA